jgi:hypothetical protein
MWEMKEKSRFLNLLLVLMAFLLNGCSIVLNDRNKEYAFYTSEFENNPLPGPRDGLTYSGAKHQINGQTNEYIVAGVFSDKRKMLRIMIPSNARGKEVKSSQSIDDFMKYCSNQTSEQAVLDVTSSPITGEISFVIMMPWEKLHDYIYKDRYIRPAQDVTPRNVFVFYDVYAGNSAVLFKRQSDGEIVLIPLQIEMAWEKRSRCNLFIRRSAYIITIPFDIVASPIYFVLMMTKGVG